MSENTAALVEQGSDGSATNQTDLNTQTQNKEETVPYTKYRELLDEKKKATAKLKEIEDKRKLDEENKLKETGQYKEVLAQREAELEAERSKVKLFQNERQNAMKLSAFMKTVGADVDEKWFSMVELDKINFKPDSNEIDQMSVSLAVDSFKKEWPEALRSKSGNLPPPNAPNGTGYITESDWKKLSGKEKAKYKFDKIHWEK